jgi:hypothetical protein
MHEFKATAIALNFRIFINADKVASGRESNISGCLFFGLSRKYIKTLNILLQ